ncbi:MAG: hypothetical protein JWN69_289 [Alphaproteobacteria bacterium]|nr:hypothetical protein [Alphaproteobacteria bacterium]
MKCRISRDLLDRFAAEAEAAAPREVCGLLLGNRGMISASVALPNSADDPFRGFAIAPADQFAAARAARAAGLRILGCYHSHPSGVTTPSLADAAQAGEAGFYWMIVHGARRRLWISRTQGKVAGRFDPVELEIVETPAFQETTALQPAGAGANRRRGTSLAPRQGPSPQ